MKRIKRLIRSRFLDGIIVFGVLVFSIGCLSTRKEPPTPTPLPTSPALVMPTYLVQRGDVVGQVRFSGSIAPVDEKPVFFLIDGRIRKVYVNKGDLVKAGQVLADLEGVDNLERQLALNQLDYRRAQLNAEIAQLNLELYKETTPGDTAGYETQLAIKERELELAQIKVEEVSTDLQGLQESITNTTVIAPMDGMILYFYASEGIEVKAFQPLISVADTSSLEVSADVSGELLAKLVVGMPVTVSPVLGTGIAMNGKIRRLPISGSNELTAVDQSTRISLDSSATEAGYEMGERVYVNVVLQQKTDTLWLPPQVVRSFEGRQFVIVQENDVQRRVDVKVGVEGEDRVEILEGLNEGQVVVSP